MTGTTAPLLEELLRLVSELEHVVGVEDVIGRDFAQLGFVQAKHRERACVGPYRWPTIALILDGAKIVAQRGRAEAGDALLIPAERNVDLVNVPPSPDRPYRALVMQVAPEIAARLRARYPDLVDRAVPWDQPEPRIMRPTRASLLALLHFARTLAEPEAHVDLLRHRLEDVLLSFLLVARHGEDGAVRSQTQQDAVSATRHLVRRAPDHAWRASEAAAQLGMSEATLRRRLAEAGTSFREVLLDERMRLARTLLRDPRLSVTEVALRCGYQSPSKFAAQFERSAGSSPSRFASRLDAAS